MNYEKTIDSIVNDVKIVRLNNTNFVIKTYNSKAKMTGITISLKRAIIEKQIIEFLTNSELLNEKINIPHILNFDLLNNYITFEYFNGKKFNAMKLYDWPSDTCWRDLGVFLGNIDLIDMKKCLSIFMDLIDVQDELYETVFNYKLKKYNFSLDNCGERMHLCLGDISCRNILYDGQSFFIHDFEMAHIGYSGYDLGQLIGNIQAIAPTLKIDNDIISSSIKEIIEGYHSITSNCYYKCWSQLFYQYYYDKR